MKNVDCGAPARSRRPLCVTYTRQDERRWKFSRCSARREERREREGGEERRGEGVVSEAHRARPDARLFLIRNNFNPLRPDVLPYMDHRALPTLADRAVPYTERVTPFFVFFLYRFFLASRVCACFRSIMNTCYAVKESEPLPPAGFGQFTGEALRFPLTVRARQSNAYRQLSRGRRRGASRIKHLT